MRDGRQQVAATGQVGGHWTGGATGQVGGHWTGGGGGTGQVGPLDRSGATG